ncbi:MAG: membrane protein insertion efficiency factor YidD [Candidatus Omnitrophica bacterium]|nr:membrane protein insertion efficiency factor YidD [Candidatus Omnitrophota bacterium]
MPQAPTRSPIAFFVASGIRAYRNILSQFMLRSCRFMPTCSEYAEEAVVRYGARRGLVMAAKRILRCQPFCRGGFDPIQ